MLIWKPAAGTVSLTMVLIAFFIVEGIFQTAASFNYRDAIPSSWGWMLASGLADLVLAGVIIWAWPDSVAWTLGLVVGVNLITSGAAVLLRKGRRARSGERASQKHAEPKTAAAVIEGVNCK
jgi:uncharacterized membrane protein HdeD (DUF308 family)